MKMPVVAIVGRPNVGKSSLLNALVGKLISIVQDMPGVTRDRVSIPLEVDGRYVELVDTGGYGFVDPDHLTDHIRHQIELAMARAQLVLFLVDCAAGRTSADEQIAGMLRKLGAKTVLVANKADGPTADAALGDFARLGLGTPIGVSALNERNLDLVIEAIRTGVDLTDAPRDIPQPEMMLAIVGKRNAGKSTLVNAIARLYEDDVERVIVSEVPGTTRDSIDVRFEKDGQTLIVIDTAGVRKKRHMVTNDIEFYSFHRAQRSIRRADVVLMLIDATEPISEPDKKLAQYIAEQFKPVVLVVNKWDLAKDILRKQRESGDQIEDRDLIEQYRQYIDAELRHLSYAPIAFVTAKEGKNVQAVIDLSQHIFKQANTRVSTSKLNQVVRAILDQRFPSTTSGRRARIYYVTQIETAPPTVVLFVNNPAYLDDGYQRIMINRMREMLPYAEVPIRLVIRPRTERPAVTEDAFDHGEAEGPGRPARAAKKPEQRRAPRPKATHRGTSKMKKVSNRPTRAKRPPRKNQGR